MKKKLLIIFILFFGMISKVFALEKEINSCDVKLNDGMYIALGIGYDSYRLSNKMQVADDEVNLFVSSAPKLNLPGITGNFIFGYGRYFEKYPNLYLGIEAFVNGSAADTDYEINSADSIFTIDTDIIVNGAYGVNVLPGFKFNNISLLYLKLGYSWSMIAVEQTIRDDGWTSVEYDTSNTTGGWSYGVGLESAFNDQFSLRGEFAYIKYQSFHSELRTEVFPSNAQYVLALVYHFT